MGEVGFGPIEVAFRPPCGATPVERVGAVGSKIDGPVKVGDGAVEIGTLQQRERAILVDIDVALGNNGVAAPRIGLIRSGQRIDGDRSREVGDGAIGVAALAPQHAAIVVSERVLRIDLDRRGVIRQRTIKIALFLPGEAARHVGDAAHGFAFVGILDDTSAAGDVAIGIVGVAILVRAATCAQCGPTNRHSTHATKLIELKRRTSCLTNSRE